MMQYRHEPDVFELMILARTRVFVSCGEDRYIVVSALARCLCLIHFCNGSSEPLRFEYLDQTAQQLQLFDGKAWDLPALANWLKSREENE
jgi:hypothetical protein